MDNRELRIHTEIGDIVAYPNNDPAYPGITVMFKPDGVDEEIDLGFCEVDTSAENGNVDIYIYSDVWVEDFTHKFSINHNEAVEAISSVEVISF